MAETKHILVLANSVRDGKHCVAGKFAAPIEGAKFKIGQKWIRLADPRDPEGAVLGQTTVLAGGRSVRPLHIIKVALEGCCDDPNHPEDGRFDPNQRWEYVAAVSTDVLAQTIDKPGQLWHEGSDDKAVPAGYVSRMGPQAATLYLIKAPEDAVFTFWKEQNRFENRIDTKRRLTFTYSGQSQEFSVTDPSFTARHRIFDRATGSLQSLRFTDRETYFCRSLTKLSAKFSRKHYKICATIFQK
jgi:hypothetical protein